jgi:hypothetical protein
MQQKIDLYKMNEKTYVIANITELNNVDYSQVDQTSADTVRKNNDLNKFILKYDGVVPTTIQMIDTNGSLFEYDGNKYFTHPQILEITSTPEWIGTQSILINVI